MYVGLLTAAFSGDTTFEQIVKWASSQGFQGLEVTVAHLKPDEVLADDGAAVRALLSDTGLKISSLGNYGSFNRNNTPETYSESMIQAIHAAALLEVDVVCTLTGFPEQGKTKMATIREDLPPVIGPLAQEAAKHGVKIAFENWFATNLQQLEHFQAVTEVLPMDNVGFNFDPSHLAWQGIDYVAAVVEFEDRIFHTHAKDVAIRQDRLRRIGVLEGDWWRYVIPGFGTIGWAEYIHMLRQVGYDGVLSIEHEDSAFPVEEGFAKGLQYLSQFV